jgi:hypothetical protein
MTLIVRPGFQFDTDASTYIEAVEGPTGDNQALETATRYAINDFVIGCKQDGIWSAIKASCILSGARTLAGALVPLAGTAPTNNNFVSGDYNRKTGLKGNGTNKALGSNYLCSIASADSTHTSFFASELVIDGSTQIPVGGYMGTALNAFEIQHGATGDFNGFARANWPFSTLTITTGLSAVQRNSSTSVQLRARNQTYSATSSKAAGTLADIRLGIFARENNVSGPSSFGFNCKSRLAFYSIGESLDLALLDARVTALITAFGVAIP